jgi:hypothetical protein
METPTLGEVNEDGSTGVKFLGGVALSNIFRGIRRAPLAVAGLALVGGFLLAGAKPAHATGSGLSFYPSTDIYPKGNFHFDADYFSSTNGKGANFSTFGLEYGAGPERDGLFGRTEFGLDYVNSGGGLNHATRLLFNAKTQLYNNSASGLRATLGVYGVGDKDLAAGNWVNLLGSKAFPWGRVTVGGAYALRDSVVTGNRTVLQLGYDKAISDKVIFAADYQSGKGQFISPGLIYLINDKAGIELSYVRGGSLVNPRNQIYFGFDYNFGKVYAPPTTENAPAGPAGAGGGGGGGGGG